MRIIDFIQTKLTKLNATHGGIEKPAETDYLSRIGESIDRANSNLEKMCFEGIEIDAATLSQMKLSKPDVFQKKPVLYVSRASNGGTFQIEVSD